MMIAFRKAQGGCIHLDENMGTQSLASVCGEQLSERRIEMGIRVISKRVVSEAKEEDILPLVLNLKKLAKAQPGFISEEIWRHLENRDEYLVVRSWDSEDDWHQWLANPQRVSIQEKIESQLDFKTEYSPYELIQRIERTKKIFYPL